MHKSIREINNCNKKSQKIHNFCHFFVFISRIFQNLNIFGDPENIQKMNHFLTIFGVSKSLDFENIFCPSGRQSVKDQCQNYLKICFFFIKKKQKYFLCKISRRIEWCAQFCSMTPESTPKSRSCVFRFLSHISMVLGGF